MNHFVYYFHNIYAMLAPVAELSTVAAPSLAAFPAASPVVPPAPPMAPLAAPPTAPFIVPPVAPPAAPPVAPPVPPAAGNNNGQGAQNYTLFGRPCMFGRHFLTGMSVSTLCIEQQINETHSVVNLQDEEDEYFDMDGSLIVTKVKGMVTSLPIDVEDKASFICKKTQEILI
ncbi:Ca2+-modulated nonselective cation channel polycystin [Balamuthia mandrillaris]